MWAPALIFAGLVISGNFFFEATVGVFGVKQNWRRAFKRTSVGLVAVLVVFGSLTLLGGGL